MFCWLSGSHIQQQTTEQGHGVSSENYFQGTLCALHSHHGSRARVARLPGSGHSRTLSTHVPPDNQCYLQLAEQNFLLQISQDHVSQCNGVTDVWDIEHSDDMRLNCDETYDSGYAFTIYATYGGNYFCTMTWWFHCMLRSIIQSESGSKIFMPTIESHSFRYVHITTSAVSLHIKKILSDIKISKIFNQIHYQIF